MSAIYSGFLIHNLKSIQIDNSLQVYYNFRRLYILITKPHRHEGDKIK